MDALAARIRPEHSDAKNSQTQRKPSMGRPGDVFLNAEIDSEQDGDQSPTTIDEWNSGNS